MKNKYRIVKNRGMYLKNFYTVQIKRWWLPFWYDCEFSDIHDTIEDARMYIADHKNNNVVEVVE